MFARQMVQRLKLAAVDSPVGLKITGEARACDLSVANSAFAHATLSAIGQGKVVAAGEQSNGCCDGFGSGIIVWHQKKHNVRADICENSALFSLIYHSNMSFAAILWDFGGVFTSSPFDAFNRYESEHNIPLDFIRGVNAKNHETNAWARFESNQIDAAAFDQAFLEETTAAGHPIPGSDVTALLGGTLRPRMVAVLKQCGQDYKNTCLTNNAPAGYGSGMAASSEAANAIAEVMSLFDEVIESSKEGIRKPNPAIYTLACERMGVAPERVVYLDDLGINLKPAKAMGMTTIKVLNETQAITDLQTTLGMTFN